MAAQQPTDDEVVAAVESHDAESERMRDDWDDPVKLLAALCEQLKIESWHLRVVAQDSDPAELVLNRSAEGYLEVLAGADNSVADLLRIVQQAVADNPVWSVHGYSREGKGPRKHIDSVHVRAPNATTAGSMAREQMWDERLTSAGCSWSFDAEQDRLPDLNLPGGGTMRVG